MGERVQKPKNGFARQPGALSGHLGFPVPRVLTESPPHLPIMASLIPEQTAAMLQGHQGGKSLAMRGGFSGRKRREPHPMCQTHPLRGLSLLPLRESQRATPTLTLRLFRVSLSFDDGDFRR